MGWFSGEPLPRSAPASDLQQMWLSLMSGDWSSIVIIPTDPGISTKVVTAALLEVARIHDVGPFKVVDAEGASVSEGARLAEEVASAIAAGSRAVVGVDSLMQSLSGVPLLRDADAALLVVRMGGSNFDCVQSTIDIIPPGRLIGSVALPREPSAEPPLPFRPGHVGQEPDIDIGPETLKVGEKTLVLNGAGVCRDSRNCDVYAGALYLESPSKNPAAIVAADEARAVRMRFLRKVGQEQVISALRKGFENNSGARMAELLPELEFAKRFIPGELGEGQVLSILYLPGKGTFIGIEGGNAGNVGGKDFADALFRCWLGERPDDPDLKDAMLGRGSPRRPSSPVR